MPNSFGFGSDTTGFSETVHNDILKEVVSTLRAGLVSMPKGTVMPATVTKGDGNNFTMISTAYPDLDYSAVTSPLTEGVAPNPLKLGIDTQSWTVAQFGAWAKITDVAQMQSPHGIKGIAKDKIARLAADAWDAKGRAALSAVSSINDTGSPLATSDLLDAAAILEGRDVARVNGIYYCLLHPYALRGLQGENGLNDFVDVSVQANGAQFMSRGVVATYRGIAFITSTKFDESNDQYPVYFLGANSMAAGDTGTLSFHTVNGATVGNELAQYDSVGFKAIGGAAVLNLAESSDGSGTNGDTVERVVKITVASGINGTL
jgi:N4-gp56 family major capsid protein